MTIFQTNLANAGRGRFRNSPLQNSMTPCTKKEEARHEASKVSNNNSKLLNELRSFQEVVSELNVKSNGEGGGALS